MSNTHIEEEVGSHKLSQLSSPPQCPLMICYPPPAVTNFLVGFILFIVLLYGNIIGNCFFAL